MSPGFFDLLGVKPAYGHAFYPDQDIDGRDRSIILSHALWKERFGGDPQILGRTVSVDGNTVTVAGIMPESFIYPAGARLRAPLTLSPAEKANRASPTLFALARLERALVSSKPPLG
ncbi:MAG: ABC transporter permease [Blastocatellia bacterium]